MEIYPIFPNPLAYVVSDLYPGLQYAVLEMAKVLVWFGALTMFVAQFAVRNSSYSALVAQEV